MAGNNRHILHFPSQKKSDKEALQRVPAYGGFVRIEFVLSFFSAFELGDLQTSHIV